MGMLGGRGVWKGQLRYFPEQSSQNNTVTREETQRAQRLPVYSTVALCLLKQVALHIKSKDRQARTRTGRPAAFRGQVRFPHRTPHT